MTRDYIKDAWALDRSIIYGSWKDGSDIYKDKKGYYVIQYDIKKEMDYKRYLKGYKSKSENIFRPKTRRVKAKGKKTRKYTSK